jgi:hypothetical protein
MACVVMFYAFASMECGGLSRDYIDWFIVVSPSSFREIRPHILRKRNMWFKKLESRGGRPLSTR